MEKEGKVMNKGGGSSFGQSVLEEYKSSAENGDE